MARNGRNTVYYIFQQKMLSDDHENYKEVYREASRDTRLLSNLVIKQGIDTVPTVSMAIPIDALPKVDDQIVRNYNNYRLLLFVMEKGVQKYGLTLVIDEISIDFGKGTASLQCSHRMTEMRNWLMPKNLVIKDMPLGYCVENVTRLGFPDDFVEDEKVLQDINYLTKLSVAEGTRVYPQLEARATKHTLQDWAAASANDRIYIPTEMPVAIDMSKEAYNTKLEITFTSSNKLEGLAEIMNNTANVHWTGLIANVEAFYPPTGAHFADGVKISKFDEECDNNILISQAALDPDVDNTHCDPVHHDIHQIAMISDPTYSQNFTDHFNRAAVFCGDVGAGVMHMTLKDLYGDADEIDKKIKEYIEDVKDDAIENDDDPTNIRQEAKELREALKLFPVGAYDKNINLAPETVYNENGTKINNEKVYKNYEMPEVANNDNREYYVTDIEQVRRDNGLIRHTVYNFSDLFPIPALQETVTLENGDTQTIDLEITNRDRFIMTMRAYLRAVRYLKAQRPVETYSFNTTALPNTDLIGKRVRFRYKKHVSTIDGCNDVQKNLMVLIDDCFYITERIITFDTELNEYGTITVDKELRPNPNEALSWELSKKLPEASDGSALGDKLYNEYNTDYNPNAVGLKATSGVRVVVRVILVV